MDWVGAFAEVSKSARLDRGSGGSERVDDSVVRSRSGAGFAEAVLLERGRWGRGRPRAVACRLLGWQGIRTPVSIDLWPWGSCCVRDWREFAAMTLGHPSPLVIDPTRVHATLSDPCLPGTFQNAPPYPYYTGVRVTRLMPSQEQTLG